MPSKQKSKSVWSKLWPKKQAEQKPKKGESLASQINFGGKYPKKTDKGLLSSSRKPFQ